MVFSTKLGITISTKTFLDGKTICGQSLYDSIQSQTNFTIFISKSPFIINNTKSSKKPTYVVGSSFVNLLEVEKNLEISYGETCALFLLAFQSMGAFVIVMQLGSFAKLFMRAKWSPSTCFFIAIIPLELWYAINPFLHLMCMVRISRPLESLWHIMHLMI